jgi:hypothetical protein
VRGAGEAWKHTQQEQPELVPLQTSLLGNLPDLVTCLGSCLAVVLAGGLAGAGTDTGLVVLIGRWWVPSG